MKFVHRSSGAQVEVRDDKVMDPQVWEPVKAPESKPAPRKRTTKTDDD